MNIQNKVAIVSEANSGLGASISLLLVEEGTRVYGLARNEERISSLKVKLGNSFIPVSLDISDETKVCLWVKSTFSDSHMPDILINNAGVGYLGSFKELNSAHWNAMINTNLNGLFYLTSAVIPFMIQKELPSHIINIGSILGKVTNNKSAGYSASKFAVQGFSEALTKELRYDGIKVSCINPGSISTRFFEESNVGPHDNMLHPKDIAMLIINVLRTPNNMLVDEITIRPLQPSLKLKRNRN